MTPIRQAAEALVTLGKDGDYHCVFVGGLPMYHGMSLDVVQQHYEKVVDKVEAALKAQRAEVWNFAISLAKDPIMIDRVGGSTGNAFGTQSHIVTHLEVARDADLLQPPPPRGEL